MGYRRKTAGEWTGSGRRTNGELLGKDDVIRGKGGRGGGTDSRGIKSGGHRERGEHKTGAPRSSRRSTGGQAEVQKEKTGMGRGTVQTRPTRTFG